MEIVIHSKNSLFQ